MNSVLIALTYAESESVMLFMAERAELWKTHAQSCGVSDPMELPRKIAIAHTKAVGGNPKPKRQCPIGSGRQRTNTENLHLRKFRVATEVGTARSDS